MGFDPAAARVSVSVSRIVFGVEPLFADLYRGELLHMFALVDGDAAGFEHGGRACRLRNGYVRRRRHGVGFSPAVGCDCAVNPVSVFVNEKLKKHF